MRTLKTDALQLRDPRFPVWARRANPIADRGFAHRVDANGIAACGVRLTERETGYFRMDRRCKQCVKLGKIEPQKMKRKYVA